MRGNEEDRGTVNPQRGNASPFTATSIHFTEKNVSAGADALPPLLDDQVTLLSYSLVGHQAER